MGGEAGVNWPIFLFQVVESTQTASSAETADGNPPDKVTLQQQLIQKTSEYLLLEVQYNKVCKEKENGPQREREQLEKIKKLEEEINELKEALNHGTVVNIISFEEKVKEQV